MPKDKLRCALITNVGFAQTVGGTPFLRMDAHAIVVEKWLDAPLGPSYQVRGFGTDGAWPIFTIWTNGTPYPFTLTPRVSDSHIMISDAHPEGIRIFAGGILKVADGTELYLQSADQDQPFDVQEFTDICAVWDALPGKVAKYWQAPNIGQLSYIPLGLFRAHHPVQEKKISAEG